MISVATMITFNDFYNLMISITTLTIFIITVKKMTDPLLIVKYLNDIYFVNYL